MPDPATSTTGTGSTTGAGSTTGTTAVTDPLAGKQTGTESNLSNWAGEYVTGMLGKAAGLADQPYEAYTGPLTAGASDLQQNAFQGLANLAIPTDKMGAFNAQTFGAEQAQQYMNPYLMAALNPQLEEARRQAQISRVADAGRMTQAGAFGGGRQAIMESEGNRNLATNLSKITGTGYADAYDKAMQQFNTEQNRGMEAQKMLNDYGMGALAAQLSAGKTQRDIEAEGIKADKEQFEEEKLDPYKKAQFMQSFLQGLPLQTQAYSYQQPSTLSTAASTAGGWMDLYDRYFGNTGRSATTTTTTTGNTTGSSGTTGTGGGTTNSTTTRP